MYASYEVNDEGTLGVVATADTSQCVFGVWVRFPKPPTIAGSGSLVNLEWSHSWPIARVC